MYIKYPKKPGGGNVESTRGSYSREEKISVN